MNLFLENADKQHPAYINVRDGEEFACVEARNLCINLWKKFQPYADRNFVERFQCEFPSRFWEMDLTCTLMDYGYSINCPKPGPDIQILNNLNSIWIEAVSPTAGKEDYPDTVPDVQYLKAYTVPEDQIKLRFTNAISAKHEEYKKNIKKGIISENDPYIIAINGAQIRFAECETHIPRIIRTVLPIGNGFIEFDRSTLEKLEAGFEYQAMTKKSNGENITTDLFLDPAYEGISGILYSNTHCFCRTEKLAQDYIFVHNPLAINKIPSGYFKFGVEYFADIEEESFALRKVQHKV